MKLRLLGAARELPVGMGHCTKVLHHDHQCQHHPDHHCIHHDLPVDKILPSPYLESQVGHCTAVGVGRRTAAAVEAALRRTVAVLEEVGRPIKFTVSISSNKKSREESVAKGLHERSRNRLVVLDSAEGIAAVAARYCSGRSCRV